MSDPLETPILLLVYRRPDTTRRVVDALRAARPKRLYVSASGPSRPSETAECEETRAVLDTVDWSCDVRRRFCDDNLGCRVNVGSGISWALEQEEEVIILEDDCVPAPSFFRFCTELLDRFRDDRRILSISGTNFLFRRPYTGDSYYFSRYPNIWGWATWKRAWRHYDATMDRVRSDRRQEWLRGVFDRGMPRAYWDLVLDFVGDLSLDTWDFLWFMSCWLENGLSVQPAVNLVKNIGFDGRATHTARKNKLARMTVGGLEFPLVHPPAIHRSARADRRIERMVYSRVHSVLMLRWYAFVHRMSPALKRAFRSIAGGGRRDGGGPS